MSKYSTYYSMFDRRSVSSPAVGHSIAAAATRAEPRSQAPDSTVSRVAEHPWRYARSVKFFYF